MVMHLYCLMVIFVLPYNCMSVYQVVIYYCYLMKIYLYWLMIIYLCYCRL